MITKPHFYSLFKIFLIAGVSPLFGAASLFATAGTQIYFSRGYETTTATTIFESEGSANFSERVVFTGKNQIHEVDTMTTPAFDPDTGYRTSQSTTPTYESTGSLYLHIGYHNNGYIGDSETVQEVILNGDLVVGRMAIENQYVKDDTTYATANMVNTITAGNTDYALVFQHSGATNENFFIRGAQGSNFILDMNIEVDSMGQDSANRMSAAFFCGGNYLQFGTETGRARTITVQASTMYMTRIFAPNHADGIMRIYSDVYVKGAPLRVFDGATIHQHGNVSVTGGVVDVYYGNSATITSKYHTYGTLDIDNVTIKNLVLFNTEAAADSYAQFDGKITIKKALAGTNMTNGFSMARTSKAGQVITFNGDVSLEDNTSHGQATLGYIAAGSVLNYNGKVTSTRTAETSLNAGTGITAKAIANLRGTTSNSFKALGIRYGAINLLKSGSAKAIDFSDNRDFGFGSDVALNVFGDNQMDLSKARISLWSPGSGRTVSGTINLNGTSTKVRGFNANNADGRRLVVDFGMTQSNMTSAEMAAQGITADMINATGAGVSQTFELMGTISINIEAGNTITFKNYIVGEDHVVCGIQLSTQGWHSETNLDSNLFRFEVADSTLVYGKDADYYFSETSVDGGWEYALVMLIPEPSEVATLFGVLALGFALYLRKKH